MKRYAYNQNQTTLRQAFNRRLLLLLVLFSIIICGLVILLYQNQTEKVNHAVVDDQLSYLLPRIKDHQASLDEDASNLVSTLEWSGMLALPEPQRGEKLKEFFTAQSNSMMFEGVVVSNAKTGQVIYDYWPAKDKPDWQTALQDTDPLWLDGDHDEVFSQIKKITRMPDDGINVHFFKEWDTEILKNLSPPNTNIFLALGNRPLVSSTGNAAQLSYVPSKENYSEYVVDGVKQQEGSIDLTEVTIRPGITLPLKLVARLPLQNEFPLSTMLIATLSITLLFGVLIFMVLGHWLRKIGSRLSELANATMHFKNQQSNEISAETDRLLLHADAGEDDQISMVAQALSSLMSSEVIHSEEQQAYLQTLELLQDAVIELSIDGRLLRATDAWKAFTGTTELTSGNINNCVHPEDRPELLEQIRSLAYEQKDQITIRFRIYRQNDYNKFLWVEGRFAAVMQNNKVVCIRGMVRDITTTHTQESQISHMALHDALTDLPNRVLLEDRMDMALSRAARSGQKVALGFIDLDHFKQVNDNFGHKVGDLLLKEVSARLASALRGSDTLSRWGGDEFVVLCPDLNTVEDAKEITQKLSALTREHITIDGTDFPFTFSAGFAIYPNDANDSEMLLAQADRAMFHAKAQGRNNIQFFTAIANQESGKEAFYLQSNLVHAVNHDQIQCWIQPIFSAQTGDVVGVEALARWHEAEHGWVEPTVFIPMAENLGLIDKLGQSVWRQAFQALANLPVELRLSINLSKRQLFSNNIVQQLLDDVASAKVLPSRIMLEITENLALSEVLYARERIAELDAQGFGISIDDFGVGYSSLSQLHEIPANELKLDISFIKRIHEKTGHSMATGIISIAKSLNLSCVAEGVEDRRTAELLTSMGVEMLQGFHFAKPMSIPDYFAWLAIYESEQRRA
ncbi:MAG: EAL domain-containing protein [Gallionella sp.]|nr:EAL domain-containing protein [Gallionella sp.]